MPLLSVSPERTLFPQVNYVSYHILLLILSCPRVLTHVIYSLLTFEIAFVRSSVYNMRYSACISAIQDLRVKNI